MTKNSFKPPRKVLVFNGAKTLVATVCSLQATSKIFFTTPQAISFACSGKYISSNAFYFRKENENVQIEPEDLGRLSLFEFDKLCGEKKRYHTVRKMAQKHRAIEQKYKLVNNQNKGKDENGKAL